MTPACDATCAPSSAVKCPCSSALSRSLLVYVLSITSRSAFAASVAQFLFMRVSVMKVILRPLIRVVASSGVTFLPLNSTLSPLWSLPSIGPSGMPGFFTWSTFIRRLFLSMKLYPPQGTGCFIGMLSRV